VEREEADDLGYAPSIADGVSRGGSSFMQALSNKGWRAPTRDSIILKGILPVGSKLRVILR
jgi:hypothetical protein